MRSGRAWIKWTRPNAFLEAIAGAFAAGFRRVKLKIRPGWALEMLRGVRQEFPGEMFHIDCEGALSMEPDGNALPLR